MLKSDLTDVIYDTLMGNTEYPHLDFDSVEDQEVDKNNCKIRLLLGGQWFCIKIDKER